MFKSIRRKIYNRKINILKEWVEEINFDLEHDNLSDVEVAEADFKLYVLLMEIESLEAKLDKLK